MFFNLPTFVEVDGELYNIDSDFRTALYIMSVYNDRAISLAEKHMFMLENIYTYVSDNGEIVTNIPENIEEAIIKAVDFLDRGKSKQVKPEETEEDSPKVMDYEKDADLYFPAINRFRETDIRQIPYMHWYTFLDCFNELDKDSPFITVLRIRSKIAKHKKLDKDEEDYKNSNPHLFDIVVNQEDIEDFDKILEQARKERYGEDIPKVEESGFTMSKEDMMLLQAISKK